MNTKSITKNYVKPDYRSYRMRPSEILKYGAAGFAIGCVICFLCYNTIYSLPLAGLTAFLFVKAMKKRLEEKRRKTLLYHFGSFVSSLHNAMRSGYSLENAVAVSAKEMASLYGPDDDMARELKYMENRMRMSVPPEELMKDLGVRSGIPDIGLFAELIAVAKRTGGNMGRLLDDTWRTVCGKIDTKQEIDRQLSSVRFEQTIMSVMPAVIILYMRFSFGGFMDGLYGNITGALIMTACLAIYAGAFMLGRKLVRIEI